MDSVNIELTRCRQADILVQILARFIKDDVEKYARRHPNKVAGNEVDYSFSIPKHITADIEEAKKEIKQSYIDGWTIEDILSHFQLEYEGFGNIYNFQNSISDQIERGEKKLFLTINPTQFEYRFQVKEKEIKRFKQSNSLTFLQDLKAGIPMLFLKRKYIYEKKIIFILIDSYPEKVAVRIIEQAIKSSRSKDTKKKLIEKINYKINKISWRIKKDRLKDFYSIIRTK